MRPRARRCLFFLAICLSLSAASYMFIFNMRRWFKCINEVEERCTDPTELLRRSFLRKSNDSTDEICQPRINIGFLKTHKCASTSLQNILFRYGLRHNLTFVLPAEGNYLSRRLFRVSDVEGLPWHHLGYNILAVHTKWNHEQVVSTMPVDTVFVTIVREPLQLFESLYSYMELDRWQSLEQFATQQDFPNDRYAGVVGANQMLWDLGASSQQMDNINSVRQFIDNVEKQFHLVMVTERMEESIVLLRHLLCWSTNDVISLRLNTRHSSTRVQLSQVALKRLRHWLRADYLLYEHFLRLFDEHVQIFGVERMRKEVEALRRANSMAAKTCGVTSANHSQLHGNFALLSKRVLGYMIYNDSAPCRNLARGELQFVEMLRQRQFNLSQIGKV